MRRLVILFIAVINLLYVYPQNYENLKYEEILRLSTQELIEKGNKYLEENSTDTALMFFIVLSGRYNENMNRADSYLCALSCVKSGIIYYQKGNYSKAFDAYLKGLQICEQNNFKELLPEFYKNIGNVYCVFQDYTLGNTYYEKGLKLARQLEDKEMEIKLLNNMAGMYCYAHQTDKAKVYYREMKEKARQRNDVLQKYFVWLNLGLIYLNEQRYDSAITCYKKSAEYAIDSGLEPQYKSSSYFELAKVYEELGVNDSALAYLHMNAGITKENNLMEMLSETLRALSRIYEKKGDKEKEFRYKGEYLTLSDSIFSLQELSKMKNAQFIYEMGQSQRTIDHLNMEKKQKEFQIKSQRRILILISVGLALFIILLVVVYAQKHKLRHAYKDLYNRNSEIIKSEQLNKKLRIEYENKLASEREHVRQLLDELKNYGLQKEPVNVASETNTPEEAKGLYSSTKLTAVQKEKLLKGINEVMENSMEFCNCDFSLETLSTLIGSNSKYVSQVINETYNKNFRTFINEYRIKEAQLRLMNTDRYGNYTIKAIAESVGYKSHTNFILIFRKITGINPSLYQKIAKEKK